MYRSVLWNQGEPGVSRSADRCMLWPPSQCPHWGLLAVQVLICCWALEWEQNVLIHMLERAAGRRVVLLMKRDCQNIHFLFTKLQLPSRFWENINNTTGDGRIIAFVIKAQFCGTWNFNLLYYPVLSLCTLYRNMSFKAAFIDIWDFWWKLNMLKTQHLTSQKNSIWLTCWHTVAYLLIQRRHISIH